jgi:mannosyltransferase OCH1-like enzyme
MIPLVTHQIWLGGPMPQRFGAWRFDLMAHNPNLRHELWNEERVSVLGVAVDRLRQEFGSWASVSNFLRLLILQKYGGIYLDSDFEPLKPLDPLFDMGDCLAAEQDGGRICNAFMAATPNHPWINWQLANRAKYDQRDAASGVYLATDAPRDGLTLMPQHWVFPFMYDAPPERRVPHAESVLVHHWDGSWSKKS